MHRITDLLRGLVAKVSGVDQSATQPQNVSASNDNNVVPPLNEPVASAATSTDALVQRRVLTYDVPTDENMVKHKTSARVIQPKPVREYLPTTVWNFEEFAEAVEVAELMPCVMNRASSFSATGAVVTVETDSFYKTSTPITDPRDATSESSPFSDHSSDMDMTQVLPGPSLIFTGARKAVDAEDSEQAAVLHVATTHDHHGPLAVPSRLSPSSAIVNTMFPCALFAFGLSSITTETTDMIEPDGFDKLEVPYEWQHLLNGSQKIVDDEHAASYQMSDISFPATPFASFTFDPSSALDVTPANELSTVSELLHDLREESEPISPLPAPLFDNGSTFGSDGNSDSEMGSSGFGSRFGAIGSGRTTRSSSFSSQLAEAAPSIGYLPFIPRFDGPLSSWVREGRFCARV